MKNSGPARATRERGEVDLELTAAIIDWASTPDRQARTPAQGPLLTFRDRGLERAYLQFEYERSRKVVVAGLGVGVLIMIGFLWLDPVIAPTGGLAAIQALRLYVAIPCTVLALIGAMTIKDASRWIPWIAVLLTLVGLRSSVVLPMTNNQLLEYLGQGVWNIMIPTFFLCGLPLRWAMAVSALICTAFAVCATLVGNSPAALLRHFAVDSVILFVFASFATYRYERATRLQFFAQAVSHIDSAQRLAAETDRRRWLEVIAAFLRHELKNAITGISTSVELADRPQAPDMTTKYFERARRGVSYMRRLLTQVADATSLESALRAQEFGTVDLSDLVRDRVSDFRSDAGARPFEVSVDSGVHVPGNADSLLQMLDKLINNALEHGDPAQPIGIELRGRSGSCVLLVSDVGDPLPEDAERIFEPFVSSKRRRSTGGNLGLGLFVARTIAEHHGGSIRAERHPNGLTGARFVVELPLARAETACTTASSDNLGRAPS